jgi:O-antigen ligase
VSFIDYEWFRVNSLLSRNQEISGINYQFTGMNSLLAFVFLLSQSSTKSKHFNLFKILFYVTCFQLILTSGARQAIFGLIAVISLYTFYFSGTGGGLKKSGSIVLGLLIVFFIVKYIKDLDISFLTKSLNPDGGNYISATGREPIYFTSFRIISENLFFGVGLGGFAEYGISLYPHNIILEILTESGLVGMFILLIVVLYFFNTSKLSIKHQTNNGTYFFLILACLFIRAFFSSDLTESIGLFSGVFALAYNRRYLQRKYN